MICNLHSLGRKFPVAGGVLVTKLSLSCPHGNFVAGLGSGGWAGLVQAGLCWPGGWAGHGLGVTGCWFLFDHCGCLWPWVGAGLCGWGSLTPPCGCALCGRSINRWGGLGLGWGGADLGLGLELRLGLGLRLGEWLQLGLEEWLGGRLQLGL